MQSSQQDDRMIDESQERDDNEDTDLPLTKIQKEQNPTAEVRPQHYFIPLLENEDFVTGLDKDCNDILQVGINPTLSPREMSGLPTTISGACYSIDLGT